jgi:hypothetical protein
VPLLRPSLTRRIKALEIDNFSKAFLLTVLAFSIKFRFRMAIMGR